MVVQAKAIETVYNGYRFRSRLEARWAVFFDKLGVPYEYEKEGFDLGTDGWYLPDFWLPEQKCWIEIKAESPTDQEEAKATRLAKDDGKHVFIFWGPVPIPDDWYNLIPNLDSAFKHFAGGEGWDNRYQWCICTTCWKPGIQFEGRSDRLPCKRCRHCNAIARGYDQPGQKPCPYHGGTPDEGCPLTDIDKGYTSGHARLVAAYTAARQARFEHGERP